MDVKEAWDVLTSYLTDLEGLAEIVDAFRDGEELGDSELNVRLEENGGSDRINEAMGILYEALGLDEK